jgi:hypothetical protein
MENLENNDHAIVEQRAQFQDGDNPIAAGQKAAQGLGVAEGGSESGSKQGKKGKGKKGKNPPCIII